ncbi:GNAT family N-acetyltransferase [Roseibium aggregatum]|uniref:GNAT family N-acetyltransferase n=1 Tax=Roseibium aggregatum TaxID=187304 RepID=UPI001E567AE9|nr:GNAT family N-acetyltransferase [Roseibium aggregatum]UES44301.1 GNAT family N-acetyltransferase [Roseibium aggregatum]
MTITRKSMQLEGAQLADLNFIRSWLEEEEHEYNRSLQLDPESQLERGFFCNFAAISRAFEAERLEVLRVDGKAIAFHFGEFIVPGITEVHPAFRGQGYGSVIMNEILGRARENEVCKLHVTCTTLQARRFWPKYGFRPISEFAEDHYLVLSHPLPTPFPPTRKIRIEFFEEMDWYCKDSGGKAYKTVELLGAIDGNQILLSEVGHDAIIGDDVSGDRRVQVSLDGEMILDTWLGTDEAEAFGFVRHPICNSYFAKSFLPTLRI